LYIDPFGLDEKKERDKCTRKVANKCAGDTIRKGGAENLATGTCIYENLPNVAATYGDKKGATNFIDPGDLAGLYDKCFENNPNKGGPDSCNNGKLGAECGFN